MLAVFFFSFPSLSPLGALPPLFCLPLLPGRLTNTTKNDGEENREIKRHFSSDLRLAFFSPPPFPFFFSPSLSLFFFFFFFSFPLAYDLLGGDQRNDEGVALRRFSSFPFFFSLLPKGFFFFFSPFSVSASETNNDGVLRRNAFPPPPFPFL